MTDSSTSASPLQTNGHANSAPVLEFRNVSIGFADRTVLEDISFSLRSDETRILLGPAGVGKSVLLKLCNGLLSADAGSIHLFGQEITESREEELFPLRTRTGMGERP